MIKSRCPNIIQFNKFTIKFLEINLPFSHIGLCYMEHLINILLLFRVKEAIPISL